MSDDLLDEATRLAANRNVFSPDDPAVRLLRALVERVQQAETANVALERLADRAATFSRANAAERDRVRAKLEKVRTRIANERARAEKNYEPDGYIDWLDDTLAILDGKE